MLEVEMLLIGGRIAQRQPRGIHAGDGSGNQAHALVFHVQIESPFAADLQDAEINLLSLQAQARLGEHLRGQFFQELIQSEIGIGELGGFPCGQG